MAYVVQHHFAGGTQAQYEATVRVVHPDGNMLPSGQLLHTAGPTEDGWNVVVVYEDRETYEKFRDGTLIPAMRAGIDGGFSVPPVEKCFEAHTLQP